MTKRICPSCKHTGIDKGRAMDGRRAYRCQRCGNVWTEGLQGKTKIFVEQRVGFQFADTQSRPKDIPTFDELMEGRKA